jgi:LacI family transcriptional regulator
MGVDNDEIGCSLNTPALTSIALNTETCGYRAAQLLDEWIRTKKKPAQGISVLPTRVVERQSTDVLHIEDPAAAQAIRFIRDCSARPVQVTDVLEVVSVSLRTLQQRFQQVLGRTINDEINRARMERVSQMLVQTNLSIKQIASDLGYPSPKHIARAFRHEKGMTLHEFRKKYGQGTHADVSG